MKKFKRPGQRLSLQKHKHRNESWTVIEGRGIGHVNRSNGELFEFDLYPSDVLNIKKGEKHRLSNKSKFTYDLVIIEVQTGKKLLESDIVRFQDDYGRIKNG